jgi:hypothetical protein
VEGWAVEGTGSYGAELAHFLRNECQRVTEVIWPDRSARRHKGKSDSVDAEAAAVALQPEEAMAVPKVGDDLVEASRCLRVARGSAMKARTKTINASKALVVTAPAGLREQLRHPGPGQLLKVCSKLRPGAVTSPLAGTKPGCIRPTRHDPPLGELEIGVKVGDRAVAPARSALAGQVLADVFVDHYVFMA